MQYVTLSVISSDIVIKANGEKDGRIFLAVVQQKGDVFHRFAWDPIKFPDKVKVAQITKANQSGRGEYTVPEGVTLDIFCKKVAETLQSWKMEHCPKVKKVQTLAKHLTEAGWIKLNLD
ncbi:MAG: hypothetical protein ACW99U_21410 [Candidatus Thorarchaeota archaeon]|jgi:hypothetical protein